MMCVWDRIPTLGELHLWLGNSRCLFFVQSACCTKKSVVGKSRDPLSWLSMKSVHLPVSESLVIKSGTVIILLISRSLLSPPGYKTNMVPFLSCPLERIWIHIPRKGKGKKKMAEKIQAFSYFCYLIFISVSLILKSISISSHVKSVHISITIELIGHLGRL